MSQEHIDALRQINEDTSELIKNTRQAFAEMASRNAEASSSIIKSWAHEIKNDKEKLKIAFTYASENNLLSKFVEAIQHGHCHRMCFRTFYVHEFIYHTLKLADQTVSEIDDILREVENSQSQKGETE